MSQVRNACIAKFAIEKVCREVYIKVCPVVVLPASWIGGVISVDYVELIGSACNTHGSKVKPLQKVRVIVFADSQADIVWIAAGIHQNIASIKA